MESVLAFVVVVAVKMIDPLSLVVAAMIAAVAASRASAQSRWIIIGVGALAMIMVFALLAGASQSQMGQRFTLRWGETAAASFLQIYLICLGLRKWRSSRSSAP